MESLTEVASQGGSGTAASLAPPRWADLPADLLIDISGRLRDATDFVRFHAVCSPWREAALLLPSPAATRRMFLPWQLAMWADLLLHLPLNLGCISPTASKRHGRDSLVLPDVSSSTSDETNWIVREDGTAVWEFTVDPRPTLTDLLTGAITEMPRFSEDDYQITRRMENSRGVVYRDGTVFLYNFDSGIFRAAIRQPGDAAWTFAEKVMPLNRSCHVSAAYHDGKILACVRVHFWFILTPDFDGKGAAAGGQLEMRWDLKHRVNSYVFESRGELIWATVLDDQGRGSGCTGHSPASGVSVTVHALGRGVDGGDKMRWMARDGQSLSDRVLFLGSPTSFTMDDTPMGVGGCAFVFLRGCLLKYSFIDGEAKLMELSPRWGSVKAHVWLQPPLPDIAPMHEIIKRAKAATKRNARKNNKQFSGSRAPRKL